MLAARGRDGGLAVTASSTLAAVGRGDGRWTWPLDAGEFDTTIALRGNERRAIAELGSVNLRRLQRQDAWAPGWSAVRRLLRPLDAANAALDSPPTSHRRRAMGDAVAVDSAALRRPRSAPTGGGPIQEWTGLIGPDQVAFRDRAPGWADDAVRPYLVPHAYLLAGFTEFHRLGSFSRLTPGLASFRTTTASRTRSAGCAPCWRGGATGWARR